MKQSDFNSMVCAMICVILMTACSGTKLTTKRLEQAEAAKPVSDILVILVADKDVTRRHFEDKFVESLKAAGVDAISSRDAIPMPADLELRKEEILRAAAEYESDAVLITHLADINYFESRGRIDPAEAGFYGWYGDLIAYYKDPGLTRSYAEVVLETNLYEVQTETLIWSGQTKSLDRRKIQVIDDVIGLVVGDLIDMKLLAPK